jgi:FAD:protein FMN transferase
MRRSRPLLGTLVEVAAEGATPLLPAAIDAAFAAIERVQRLMSFHDPDSDVSRINRTQAGRSLRIDPHTAHVLRFAQALSEASDGLFDVSTAPTLVAVGFLPERRREAIAPDINYRDLALLPGCRVRWCRKGLIDLGGIAKGYAVDCAIAALRCQGIATGIVNAGGDLRCFGDVQPIHVRHPGAPTTLMQLGWLADAAVATSAGYFSGTRAGARRIDPLVDPRRRRCTRWNASVSVVATDGMTADALTKVVRLAPESAPDILDRFDAQAIVIDRHGSRSCGRRRLRHDCWS